MPVKIQTNCKMWLKELSNLKWVKYYDWDSTQISYAAMRSRYASFNNTYIKGQLEGGV